MEPSIRTHDKLFEQLLGMGIGAVIVILVCVGICVYLYNRDRRY